MACVHRAIRTAGRAIYARLKRLWRGGLMGPRETLFDDNQDLRRCLRDLVALSTLPAVWLGYDTQHIAESLADALLGMLRLDFTYVCVKRYAHDAPLEVARTKAGLN